jgi:thaumarchaeosortase
VSHEAADLAFQLQGLLFRCLCKLSLERVLLPTVTPLLSRMLTFTPGKDSPLASLVECDRVSLMLLTLWTIRSYFLGDVHFKHDRLCIKKTTDTLILFRHFLRRTYCRKFPNNRRRYSFISCWVFRISTAKVHHGSFTMLNNSSNARKMTDRLQKLLPLLTFLVPTFILYFLDPFFDKTWKGRIFYVFFLWLISLEIILNWEELRTTKIKWAKSIRTGAFILILLLPTVYVLAEFCGLNAIVQDLATRSGIYWAAYMPLSTEYLVFAALFVLTIVLQYGGRAIKVHSISALFLAAIGVVYTIDNIFPGGSFTPFQLVVPTTAMLAANFLNLLGYPTATQPGSDMFKLAVIHAPYYPSFLINWPCSGVESLLIYTVVILLFLRNSAIPWMQRIAYFVLGAAVTFSTNILRIVTICLIGANGADISSFHDYYGPLYSIAWIVSYPLLIMGSQALIARNRNNTTFKSNPLHAS